MKDFGFPDDPAFLMYSDKWIEGTMEMLPAEKGIYIDLLVHQHTKGSLPMETKRLAKLCAISEREFLKYWPEVLKKFVKKNGRYINLKLYDEMQKRMLKSKKNKIISVFAALLRTAELDKDQTKQMKEWFDTETYMETDYRNITEVITERWHDRLKSIININKDKDINKNRRFIPPTLNEVREYIEANNYLVDPEEFIDSNKAKGWKVGKTKTPMKDWKAVIRTWHRNAVKSQKEKDTKGKPPSKMKQEYKDLKDYKFDNEPKKGK